MNATLAIALHRQLRAETGLSLADYDVLVQLSDHPDGRMRAGDLARALHWEKSRLSHQVARMRERRLVTKEQCPDDARGAFIALTGEGRRALEQAAPAHVDWVRDLVFDQLTDDDVRALGRITERVLTRLRQPDVAEPGAL